MHVPNHQPVLGLTTMSWDIRQDDITFYTYLTELRPQVHQWIQRLPQKGPNPLFHINLDLPKRAIYQEIPWRVLR